MRLIERVKAALSQAAATTGRDLFNEPIVLGTSGGPDSLALLHTLRSLRRSESLIVAHLDHGLRPGSAGEASIVAAEAGDLRFYSERVDVAGMARTQGLSVEEAGRLARYHFLAEVAGREGASAVAVGHHADDQAETILMHLLRGSGLNGLAGMREASPLAGHEGLWLVRPLLGATRDEIESYCVQHGFSPIIDASNTDPAYFRNRIRHELLPLLELYNPQIRQRLRHMGEVIAADEDLLRDLTQSCWEAIVLAESETAIELNRESWRALPLAMRRRTLRRAISRLQPDLRDTGFETLESARSVAERGETGSTSTLPGGSWLSVDYGKLLIGNGPALENSRYPRLLSDEVMALPVPGEIVLAAGWRLTAERIDHIDMQAITTNDDPWTAYVDTDPNKLVVRPRKRGERIRPLGLGGATKVKESMIDRKIPAAARERWPIVATGYHAVWIAGHVLDERTRVSRESGPVVRLRCFQAG